MSSLESSVIGQYQLLKLLSSGSFGSVYQAKDKNTNELVAVKVSNEYCAEHNVFSEFKMLTKMKTFKWFPKVLFCGKDENLNRDYLVQELLDRDLWELLEDAGGKFSLKTTLMLAIQIIDLLEKLHCKSFIHRDIKPDNFMMGRGENSNTVHLIDFGLATEYRRNGLHVEYCDTIGGLLGNSLCSSVSAHLGIQQSRRDDMEAFAYMLVLLLKGTLPWQKLNVEPRHLKYEMIGKMKASTSPEILCEGLPKEFSNFIKYARALEYDQAPDYTYLRQMFHVLLTNSEVEDNHFDWSLQNQDVNGTSVTSIEKSSKDTANITVRVPSILEISSSSNENKDEKCDEKSSPSEASLEVRGPFQIPGTNHTLMIIDNTIGLELSGNQVVQILPITRL